MAPDHRVEEPYRLTPQTLLRTGVLAALTVAVFVVLFLRLWSLEVLSSKQYLQSANSQQERTFRVQARRGDILDEFGRKIVTSRESTAIQIRPADLPKRRDGQQVVLRRLVKLTHVPFLELRQAIDERVGEGDILTPIVVKADANWHLIAYVQENPTLFPGVLIANSHVRAYPYGSVGAHLLGYVSEVTKEEIAADKGHVNHPGDFIGQSGIEHQYDQLLRGQAGIDAVFVDSFGHPVRDDSCGQPKCPVTHVKPAKPGYALRLTIDLKLQEAAENALLYGIHAAQVAHQWDANGGAIVALDPRDGSVRALASYPTFKPSLYTGHVTTAALKHAGLMQPTASAMNYPALDRATSGIYAPGSTFKPMTAIAGLETPGILSAGELIPCPGSKVYAGQRFHNWDPYSSGAIDLATALSISCDTYFYEVGYRIFKLGQSHGHPIQDLAGEFGFGKKTGIDVGGEETGLLPTPEWRIATYTKKTDPLGWAIDSLWKPGDSIQLAIGQKDLRVTPLQMARFYAAVANGGKLVTPHVFQYAEEQGTPLPESKNVPPSPRRINLHPGVLDSIRAGLYKATHDTTGTSSAIFGSFPVPIAGKTGTAEQGTTHLKDQSWWCGFGPIDKPTLVVCAIIENGGHGGTAAAPAARMVFEQFFHKTGQTVGTVKSD